MMWAFLMLIGIVAVGGGIFVWKITEYDEREDPFSITGRIRFFEAMEKWEEEDGST